MSNVLSISNARSKRQAKENKERQDIIDKHWGHKKSEKTTTDKETVERRVDRIRASIKRINALLGELDDSNGD